MFTYSRFTHSRQNARFIFLVILFALALQSCSMNTRQPDGLSVNAILQQLPTSTTQAVVVSNQSWQHTQARLQRYQRSKQTPQAWQKVGEIIPVQLGRSGLAWGAGLHQSPTQAVFKKEGDGKAPAGIFAFGTAFGYGNRPAGISLPYRKVDAYDYYIDDVTSADYNQWQRLVSQDKNAAKQRWQSFERMRRDDHVYELGLEILHNKSPIIAGQGSAIFMHIWQDANTPTAGCTAMEKTEFLTILRWLNPKKQPLLVQMPMQGMQLIQQKALGSVDI